MFGIGNYGQNLEETLVLAPFSITRPKKDRFGNVIYNMTGLVIRELIRQSVFVDDDNVKILNGSQVFATECVSWCIMVNT